MLDFLLGMLAGKALFSSQPTLPDNDFEQEQIRKVLEVANTINLMGATLLPDTEITEALKKLKIRFDTIDESAIHNVSGRKNYTAVRDFFKKNGII